ncbi:MATE family efflux transporter [Pseudogracilibacillus auburnensis]|uniref:Multidrug export protein MepA n=1 Tax=Pseudogracilibacillus auburnensis TaxID=1494959 RepID=A0A2V3WE83_9BACI|nr:MATE family efflux transporter [Pseudogracilibacillus auburnensis]MBO1001104.1 MATE family efflux transporter [Pseudogracilibacillus auburnensis]PXW90535.1 putative MATE family efflux protein [Pseudogracilibacillus auburnensis]
MEKALKIETRPLGLLFVSYLFPAMIGTLLMSVNILIDGIFVSQGVGPTALAGVNIAVPIFSVLLSISLWIGMGGATLYSVSLGRNDVEKARKVFTLSFVLMFLIVMIITTVLLIQMENIAYLFGANDQTYPYAKEYLYIILVFGMIYTIENLLSIFIRNDGNPKLAMAGLVVTSILNIIFNYFFIFVWEYGVTGVALATVLSTVIGVIVLSSHFFRKGSYLKFVGKFVDKKDIVKIVGIGFPSFVVESTVAIMVVLYNVTFLYYLGTEGVTAYAMVNYLHVVLMMIFFGIGMALQPLSSYHYGARLMDRVDGLLKIAIKTGIGIGLVIAIFAFLFPGPIMSVFGGDINKGRGLAVSGFGYFALGYIFFGINMVLMEFFQSIERIRMATIITLLRSVILFIPLLIILPKLFGPTLIWWVFPITEGTTVLLVGTYLLKNNKRIKDV